MEEETPSFEIRRMQAGDIPAIVAIETLANPSPWSEQQFREELVNPRSTVDLLIVGREIAAYLCSWLIADELQIQNVATSPAFRRRGLAEKLMRHTLKNAVESGVKRVFLEVRASNAAARELYGKFSFVDNGIRKNYYADNEDARLMELNLVDGTK